MIFLTASIEAKGTRPLASLLDKFGGWPLLMGQKWQANPEFIWTDLVLKMKDEGIAGGYLLGLGVGADVKEKMRRIITVGEPQLSFGREQLPNPVFTSAYQKYHMDLALLMGAENTHETHLQVLSVLQFERNLANVSSTQN